MASSYEYLVRLLLILIVISDLSFSLGLARLVISESLLLNLFRLISSFLQPRFVLGFSGVVLPFRLHFF